jgi:hypothetical protein
MAWASFGQTTSNAQAFALSDTKDLVPLNVKADAIEYKGRKAVRLTKDTEKDGFALLRGTDFQDGAIEADMALKITTPPGVRMPGFVGIAFIYLDSDFSPGLWLQVRIGLVDPRPLPAQRAAPPNSI